MSGRFASHSRWKNQILTALKRDNWHAELDLTNSSIGNDSCNTVQATHEWAIFSCGNGVGFVPVNEPGKYGQAHAKATGGSVSDLAISPFPLDRQCIVSSTDGQVRVYNLPTAGGEVETSPVITFRASGGTASTPVLVQYHPQVSGVFAIASGNKADIVSIDEGVQQTISFDSPAISAAWSHDGKHLLVVSKDFTLRVFDARSGDVTAETRLVGSKPVVRCLPDDKFIISNLSRSRERQINLYNLADPSKSMHTWSLGTASTPLIPVPDYERKIVYLLDKSAGTLRWIESFAPWNEGAASTAVEQSSGGTLVQPLALKLMEAEINRFMVADTKGNLVPVKISIGRKSYLEFHDDLYDEIPVGSSITAQDWFAGKDGHAKVVSLNPKLVESAEKGQDFTSSASVPVRQTSQSQAAKKDEDVLSTKLERTTLSEPEPQPRKAAAPTQAQAMQQKKPQDAGISAREQRAFERAEAKERESASRAQQEEVKGTAPVKVKEAAPVKEDGAMETPQVKKVDVSSKKAEDKAAPVKQAIDSTESSASIGRGRPPTMDDEDALEQARSRRVTPAIESQAAQQSQAKAETVSPVVQSLQPQRPTSSNAGGAREVYREDPSQRRAEYGATVKKGSLFAQRMAQYDAVARGEIVREPSPEGNASPRPAAGGKEVFREDKTSRRSEYGAPSKLTDSPRPTSAAASSPVKREQSTPSKPVETNKPVSPTKPTPVSSGTREVYKEDLSARRAEYGAQSPAPSKSAGLQKEESFKAPSRASTALRSAQSEDLRHVGAATPKLDHISTANKEIQKALGNPEPQTPVEPEENVLEPYKASDEKRPASPTREALEDAYVVVEKSDADGAEREQEQSVVRARDTEAPAIEDAKSESTATKEKTTTAVTPDPAKAESKSTADAPAASPEATSASTTRQSRAQGMPEAILPEYKDYTRKYLTGKMHHPRESFTSFTSLNAGLPNTARMIDATRNIILCPLAGPGGRVGIISASKPGRMPTLIPALMGGAVVADFELDRFTTGRAVSAHVDQGVRVWQIPADLELLESDIEMPVRTLTGFDRILSISFHPSAKDLLMVVTPTKVHVVNVETAEQLSVYAMRGTANATWSLDGEQIAVGKSDKSVTVLDAHDGSEILSMPSAHSSTRPFRLAFVGEHHLVTAGFGKGSTREVALYNLAEAQHLDTVELDISPSPFSLPYFDVASRVLFLTPRGTSNILAFSIKSDTITQLPTYSAADPVMGVAFLPLHDCNVAAVEVAKALRLTTNEISVVGWEIPRPEGAFFHDDIFPEEVRDAYVAGQEASAWQQGKAAQFKMVSLNPKNLKSATSAGIGKQASLARQQAKRATGKPSSSGSDGTPQKKKGELDQMFDKAKAGTGEDDEPEYTNTAANTRWD